MNPLQPIRSGPALLALALAGAGPAMFAAADDLAPPLLDPPASSRAEADQGPVRPLLEGPLHEAFLSPAKDAEPTRIDQAPPPPISERPGVDRPNPSAQWIEGYWEWDRGRNDFVWTTGTWRVPPPGKFWVNGYWRRDEAGWARVRGFWSDRKTDRLDFRAEGPPAERPDEQPGPSPGAEYFWIPGQWIPDGDGVAWKKGFWAKAQPGWAWVPGQWVKQPEGWTFQDGYWDRTLEDRGTLFSPAEVANSARGGDTVYAPVAQVSPLSYGRLYGAFGRPTTYYDGYPGCYYDTSGAYYGYANYGNLGMYYGYLDYPYYGSGGYPYLSTGAYGGGSTYLASYGGGLGYGGLGYGLGYPSYGGIGYGLGCGLGTGGIGGNLLSGLLLGSFRGSGFGYGFPGYAGLGYGGLGYGGFGYGGLGFGGLGFGGLGFGLGGFGFPFFGGFGYPGFGYGGGGYGHHGNGGGNGQHGGRHGGYPFINNNGGTFVNNGNIINGNVFNGGGHAIPGRGSFAGGHNAQMAGLGRSSVIFPHGQGLGGVGGGLAGAPAGLAHHGGHTNLAAMSSIRPAVLGRHDGVIPPPASSPFGNPFRSAPNVASHHANTGPVGRGWNPGFNGGTPATHLTHTAARPAFHALNSSGLGHVQPGASGLHSLQGAAAGLSTHPGAIHHANPIGTQNLGAIQGPTHHINPGAGAGGLSPGAAIHHPGLQAGNLGGTMVHPNAPNHGAMPGLGTQHAIRPGGLPATGHIGGGVPHPGGYTTAMPHMGGLPAHSGGFGAMPHAGGFSPGHQGGYGATPHMGGGGFGAMPHPGGFSGGAVHHGGGSSLGGFGAMPHAGGFSGGAVHHGGGSSLGGFGGPHMGGGFSGGGMHAGGMSMGGMHAGGHGGGHR